MEIFLSFNNIFLQQKFSGILIKANNIDHCLTDLESLVNDLTLLLLIGTVRTHHDNGKPPRKREFGLNMCVVQIIIAIKLEGSFTFRPIS